MQTPELRGFSVTKRTRKRKYNKQRHDQWKQDEEHQSVEDCNVMVTSCLVSLGIRWYYHRADPELPKRVAHITVE